MYPPTLIPTVRTVSILGGFPARIKRLCPALGVMWSSVRRREMHGCLPRCLGHSTVSTAREQCLSCTIQRLPEVLEPVRDQPAPRSFRLLSTPSTAQQRNSIVRSNSCHNFQRRLCGLLVCLPPILEATRFPSRNYLSCLTTTPSTTRITHQHPQASHPNSN